MSCWDLTLDFEYVVNEKPKPRICFGTGLDRDVLPSSGPALSPFMRRYMKEDWEDLGPTTHDPQRGAFYDIQHRHYSKLYYGRKSPRWTTKHEFQPPLKELPPVEPIPRNCAPFNSTSRRQPLFKATDTPAPCDTSKGEYKRKQIKFAYSFSGTKVLKCAVQIKCVPYNLDECGVCGCSCSAQGDYWAFENRIFLCRECYAKLFTHFLAKFQGANLSKFKSIRDCFFAHAHNSCKAAVKLMKTEEINKILRKEAYLDLYFPQRRFSDIQY